MDNPFFRNCGPFNILDILTMLDLNFDSTYEDQNIADIKDLY